MRPAAVAKIALSAIQRPGRTARLLRPVRPTSRTPEQAARMAGDWLLAAQAHSTDGDGYARRFSLYRGWDKGYIETTGYIVPTLLDLSDRLGEPKYRDSALRAGAWLLGVQKPDGAFADIDSGKSQAFDTGQVLLGLNRLAVETGEERYLNAAVRAAKWLDANLEDDGPWRRAAFNERPHAYYTRVAAAQLETGRIAGLDHLIASATCNLAWSADQRQPNGYYRYSEFEPGVDALLHTIVYVLEGFVMAYDLTGDRRWGDHAAEGAVTLSKLVDGQGLLHSQYAPDWTATNTERCVTGLAQYAGVCFDVVRQGGDPALQGVGRKVLNYLMDIQLDDDAEMAGALPSSMPPWGYYGGMELFNWNVKFYLDALLRSGLIPLTPAAPASRAG